MEFSGALNSLEDTENIMISKDVLVGNISEHISHKYI